MYKGLFSRNEYPPVSKDWVDSDVEGFILSRNPVSGDIVSFDYPPNSYDHVGIYMGNGLYLSATDGSRNGRVLDGIMIKPIPYNDFDNDQINYNHKL